MSERTTEELIAECHKGGLDQIADRMRSLLHRQPGDGRQKFTSDAYLVLAIDLATQQVKCAEVWSSAPWQASRTMRGYMWVVARHVQEERWLSPADFADASKRPNYQNAADMLLDQVVQLNRYPSERDVYIYNLLLAGRSAQQLLRAEELLPRGPISAENKGA